MAATRNDLLIAVALDRQLDLAQAIRGRVIDPAHPEYDLARGVFNGTIVRRPAVIVRPLDAADVATAVGFARELGLPISVRGGGHNVAGHAVCDDGVMIDLRLMRDVTVDARERIARAGGGATWNDFDPVCQRHGLATPGGTFGTTGVAGLALGGGIGHLISRHGLTLDNLFEAEVVTADGTIVIASEDANADLLWGLRGGGGNFGVVTRFTFRVHELPPLIAGLLVYDYAHAADVLRRFRDIADGASDDLAVISLLTHERASGTPVAIVSVCCTGSSDDTRSRLDELRATPGLLVDGVGPMSYLQLQGIFGELPVGLRHYWKGHFVGALPDELIDFALEHFVTRTSPMGGILIEPMSGFARRVPDDATAFANRAAAFNVSALGIWQSPEDDERETAWARAFGDGVAPHSFRGGGYVNYMASDEPLERVQAAFGPEKFARLRELKRRFDPDNVFRHNQNIPPAD